MTDKLGKVVWNVAMDPFGNIVPQKGRHGAYIRSVQNNLRFPGQYYDAESELHQNWHRDYDPKLGRYVEADPAGLDGGANLFVYGLNSPVVLLDPTGLECCPSWRQEAIRQFTAADINYGARVVYAEASCASDDDRFAVSSVLLNRIGATGIPPRIEYTLYGVANAPGQFAAISGSKFANSDPNRCSGLNDADCGCLNRAIAVLSASIFVGRSMFPFDEFRAAAGAVRTGWTRIGGNDFHDNPRIYVP